MCTHMNFLFWTQTAFPYLFSFTSPTHWVEESQGSPLLQLSSASLAEPCLLSPALVITSWEKERKSNAHSCIWGLHGRGAELDSRCHEGGSKVGFTARFPSIMLRLLPGPPSSWSSLGFCSEGLGNEADGHNTRQRLLVEGRVHVARLSCGASWSKATSGVCCVAQGLCPTAHPRHKRLRFPGASNCP